MHQNKCTLGYYIREKYTLSMEDGNKSPKSLCTAAQPYACVLVCSCTCRFSALTSQFSLHPTLHPTLHRWIFQFSFPLSFHHHSPLSSLSSLRFFTFLLHHRAHQSPSFLLSSSSLVLSYTHLSCSFLLAGSSDIPHASLYLFVPAANVLWKGKL